MSRLSELRAALDELDAAQDGYDPSRPADERQYRQFCKIMAAMDRLHDLEDITTIRALLDVAEAAREVGIYIDEDYFNADEERVFGRLAASLAPLVKEGTTE
jgi:hypothetical protein